VAATGEKIKKVKSTIITADVRFSFLFRIDCFLPAKITQINKTKIKMIEMKLSAREKFINDKAPELLLKSEITKEKSSTAISDRRENRRMIITSSIRIMK